jgi:GNAT superfamily N-acetyltransferase
MHIEQFDPTSDTGRLRSCYQIMETSRSHDDPSMPPQSFAAFTGWWVRGYNGNPRQRWLASNDDGEPVGCYLLTLPERENPTMAMCFLAVAPGCRRSGIGTALLTHAARRARLAGRSRLASEAKDGSPGAAFATAVGASSGIAEVIRQLSIDAGLPSRLGGLRAGAERHARGYTLLCWRGASPDELIGDVARLNAAMADAPRDAQVEPEVWDPDRIRAMEQVGISCGQQYYSVAARCAQTGQLAALTQLSTDPGTPGWGFQLLTAVLPEHRGHRLGLLVKVAMLELLTGREPDIRRIVTGNADANEHMIAINAALGFEVSSVYRSWHIDAAAAGL